MVPQMRIMAVSLFQGLVSIIRHYKAFPTLGASGRGNQFGGGGILPPPQINFYVPRIPEANQPYQISISFGMPYKYL